MKKISAAIIGLGKVGQGYDYDQIDDSYIKTHATGFSSHEAFDLVAAVDSDALQCKRFEEKFGCPAYQDVKTMLSLHHPQVISIATPTNLHHQVFQEVMNDKPEAVLCEKPISDSLKNARHMLELAEESECALLVNYTRRFDPGVILLKETIQNGEIGEIYKGTAWYSKGFLNNGSHFVDLLSFLFGGVEQIKVLDKGRKWDGKDPEPDVCIRFGKIVIYFLSAREECFSLFDMELVGDRGMIRYTEGGASIEVRQSLPHPDYSGYKILNPEKRIIHSYMERCQWNVLDNLNQFLIGKSPLNSDGRSAIETMEVVENVFSLL